MIEAWQLHRLVQHLVADLTAEGLRTLANHHQLDLQDEAVLFRVASGEGPFSPVIQHTAVPPQPNPNIYTRPTSIS